MQWTGGDADVHAGVFLSPACLGYCVDTRRGLPPPPMVPSMQHAGSMSGSARDASAHRAMQEWGGVKEKALGSKG